MIYSIDNATELFGTKSKINFLKSYYFLFQKILFYLYQKDKVKKNEKRTRKINLYLTFKYVDVTFSECKKCKFIYDNYKMNKNVVCFKKGIEPRMFIYDNSKVLFDFTIKSENNICKSNETRLFLLFLTVFQMIKSKSTRKIKDKKYILWELKIKELWSFINQNNSLHPFSVLDQFLKNNLVNNKNLLQNKYQKTERTFLYYFVALPILQQDPKKIKKSNHFYFLSKDKEIPNILKAIFESYHSKVEFSKMQNNHFNKLKTFSMDSFSYFWKSIPNRQGDKYIKIVLLIINLLYTNKNTKDLYLIRNKNDLSGLEKVSFRKEIKKVYKSKFYKQKFDIEKRFKFIYEWKEILRISNLFLSYIYSKEDINFFLDKSYYIDSVLGKSFLTSYITKNIRKLVLKTTDIEFFDRSYNELLAFIIIFILIRSGLITPSFDKLSKIKKKEKEFSEFIKGITYFNKKINSKTLHHKTWSDKDLYSMFNFLLNNKKASINEIINHLKYLFDSAKIKIN